VAQPREVLWLCCPAARQHEHRLPAPALQPILPLRGGQEGLRAANRWSQARYKENWSFNCGCFVCDPISFTEADGCVLSSGLLGSSWVGHWRGHLGDQGAAEQAALVSETKCSSSLQKKAFGESYHIFSMEIFQGIPL